MDAGDDLFIAGTDSAEATGSLVYKATLSGTTYTVLPYYQTGSGIGVDGGIVYVTGIDHGLQAEAAWGSQHCRFRIPTPPAHEAVPDLGTLVCRPEAGRAEPASSPP